MNRVKLGDVSNEVKERCPTPELNDLPAVGLEHLDPERLSLRRFGNPGQNGFTKRFKGGDILFGRRRAYQKKAAVATSDGVCSGDIIVIRPIEQKIDPLLLPFIIQNDFFFDFAIGNSAGSLSPRVKWARLAEFEFSLPDKENQHRLEETLWSCEEVIEDYDALLDLLDGVTKSRFVEMFGDSCTADTIPLKDCCANISGGCTPSMKHLEYYGGDIPFIKSGDVKQDQIEKGTLWLTREALDKTSARIIPEGTVLVVVRSALLQRSLCTAVTSKQVAINQDIKAFQPNQKFAPVYLLWSIRAHEPDLLHHVHSTSTTGLDLNRLLNLEIKNVPLVRQKEFTSFVEQVNKSVFA